MILAEKEMGQTMQMASNKSLFVKKEDANTIQPAESPMEEPCILD